MRRSTLTPRLLLPALLLLGGASATHAQRVRYVDHAATGAGDGTSWADAFTALQDALGAAVSGDEVWVAQGTYRPDQGQRVTAGDREASFQFKSGMALYGGFAGSEVTREERDWEANATVLSGDLLGNDNDNVTDAEPTRQDNSYHVVVAVDVYATAVLDGFMVTGGNANGPIPDNRGGGLWSLGSSPVVTNVVFMANSTIGGGGGMKSSGGNPRLTNVTFIDNAAAGHGGGMESYMSSPTLREVTFRNNTAGGFGGGLFNNFTDARITGSVFVNNKAHLGGGVFNNESNPVLTNVLFLGNRAANDGGGVMNDESNPTLVNVVFSGNAAANNGGGLYNHGITTTTLINVVFSGNTAGQDGGAIYHHPPSLTIANALFWGNRAGGSGDEIYNVVTAESVLSHSLIEGGLPSGTRDGGGNLFSDPLFVDADGADDMPGTDDDDLRLQMNSPAIDAGNNAALPADLLDFDGDGDLTEPIAIDVDGNLRIVDGGSGMAVVDMGAYEFDAPPVRVTVERAPPEIAEQPVRWTVYPNPFRDQTTLAFSLRRSGPVQVLLYDVLGRQVERLYEGVSVGGPMHTLRIDGRGLPAGVYFVRLLGDGLDTTRTILLLR